MTPERPKVLVLAFATAVIVALAGAATVAADSPAPGSAAPAASGGPTSSGGPAPSGGNVISIVQKTFQPSTLTVHVGDTVTWTVTQAISDPHSVTSGSYKDAGNAGKEFDSGIKLKNDGDSFSHQFTTAGTYAFFCAVHPDTMSGTITVVEAGAGTEGGGGEDVPTSSKVIAAVVLLVALVILFGWARLYRRMNRA